MNRMSGSVVVRVGLAILAYGLLASPFLESIPAGRVLGSLSLAVALLVAAWAWMLARGARSEARSSRRLTTGAWGVVALLAALATFDEARGAVLPAIVLTFPVTLLGVVPAWRAVAALLAAPLLFTGFYFGAVLVLVGILASPRRLRPYLHELFPSKVGRAP